MPELPDIVIYLEALEKRVLGQPLERVRLGSPFVLRSVTPPLERVNGRRVIALSRLGKRVVFGLEGGLFLVLHLMIAGRLRWRPAGTALTGKIGLAALDFPVGTLLFTEAGSKKRASMYVVEGEAALKRLDPGGVDVFRSTVQEFRDALTEENHTLKRVLTDPHVFSGIGNAYSDEILHAARLSPLKLTRTLDEEEIGRLHEATKRTLAAWVERLRDETGEAFPEKVTAFREGMAVHGRFGQPCPVCGAPVQRIVYAENEVNYCARCQTGGRLLADRALSRLLGPDWPRRLEE